MSLSELCGDSPRYILVYFNNFVNMNIVSKHRDKKDRSWESFQDFCSILNHFPAGLEIEYWYGSGKNAYSSPEFSEKDKPYQAFIRLFDNAIQGYSCFIGSGKLEFSSWRCNYDALQPGEGLIHDKHTLWTGKSDVFLKSAEILYNTFHTMEKRGYEVVVEGMHGIGGGDIRIIYPETGALFGSLCGSNSATLLIENTSLEKIVEKQMKSEDRVMSYA